jgi:hypothetical protein
MVRKVASTATAARDEDDIHEQFPIGVVDGLMPEQSAG